MKEIIELVKKMSESDSSVLLIGETGVGKEIFAEYIHRISARSQNPFLRIGLSAMPSDLMGSELFGHEQGSFTSAHRLKKGLFEVAHHGTVFLDDIDDVPMDIQAKLLRVLEAREIMRVGGTAPIPVDIRLISASKVDLKEMIRQNLFREDLYYRINVVPILIPPLRERRDDIPLLVEHFLKMFSPGRDIEITPEALIALINYQWPGNVRELRNVIQRVSLFCEEKLKLKDLPPELNQESPVIQIVKACNLCFLNDRYEFNQIVHCVESNLIKEALKKTHGNQSEAAKSLGLSLSTFRDKMQKYLQSTSFPACE
jgi:transcriptional regulator with PAS, ATPase and Fis domain